jgi:AbrB family looped-hinge helix DNA binding protein
MGVRNVGWSLGTSQYERVFMSPIAVQVSKGGRIVIPAEIRQKMAISAGDKVLLSGFDDIHELRIATRKQRLAS